MGPANVRRTLFVAIALCAQAGTAEEFSWQIAGGYDRIESGNSSEIDTATVAATYFVQPVDDALGPLALTPFLSRSSRISFCAQRVNSKRQILAGTSPGPIPLPPVTLFATDESAIYSLRGRHVWQDSGWFVGGGVQYLDFDGAISATFETERDKDGIELSGGKYLGSNTAVWITANSSTETINTVGNVLFSPTQPLFRIVSDTDIETDTVSVSAMHVGGSTGLRYAVSGEALTIDTNFTSSSSLFSTGAPLPNQPGIGVIAGPGVVIQPFTDPVTFSLDSQQTYSVAGELFPTDRLGVRIGYTSYSNFGNLDERYEISTQWFFKRAIAVEFAIARTSFDTVVSGFDQDEAQIRFIGRL